MYVRVELLPWLKDTHVYVDGYPYVPYGAGHSVRLCHVTIGVHQKASRLKALLKVLNTPVTSLRFAASGCCDKNCCSTA